MNGKTGRVLNGQVTGPGPCGTQWAECGLGAGWFKAVPAFQLSEPGYGYHEEIGWPGSVCGPFALSYSSGLASP